MDHFLFGEAPIHIMSWGLKKGHPPKADIYLDARGLPDHQESATPEQREAIRKKIPYKEFLDILLFNLESIPKRRLNRPFGTQIGQKDGPIIICCLCAFGISRSVALRRLLAEQMKQWWPARQIKETN